MQNSVSESEKNFDIKNQFSCGSINSCNAFVWKDADWDSVDRSICRFAKNVFVETPRDARECNPLLFSALIERVKHIHTREMIRSNGAPIFLCSCLPGALRLFCSAEGDYYPCERVENHEFFRLGNVQNGFDSARAAELLHSTCLRNNCDLCTANRLCQICPAVISIKDDKIDTKKLSETCRSTVTSLKHSLMLYTSIMEKNPDAFNLLLSRDESLPSWLKSLKFVLM